MSVIKGQINIKNTFSKVVDVKLKFVINDKDDSYDELFFNDILPSIETDDTEQTEQEDTLFSTSFSTTVPAIAKEKVTIELETRVRPILDDGLTGPLEYQIYRAKFNESINLSFEDNNLTIIIGDKKFSLDVPESGIFDVKPILVYTHLPVLNEKRVAHGGCPVNYYSYHPITMKTMTDKARHGWFFKFFEGHDHEETPVTEDDLENFDDNFGSKLVKLWKKNPSSAKNIFTMRCLLNVTLVKTKQKSFVVADGANISWSEENKKIDRHIRFIVTCQSNDDHKRPIDLIFIVSSPHLDSKKHFLQVAAWSNKHRAFNFYQRNNKKEWWWLGNSWNALKYPTRGKGPFDGHVNGSLVMKELNKPWVHWNSQSFIISDCLDPEDPLRHEPLFENRLDANILENIVKDAVSEWNNVRLDKCTDFSSLDVSDVDEFMRQIIDNTTYNIIAINKEFSSITPQDELFLPASFFINIDMINQLSDVIDFDISPIKVRADMYLNSIKKYGVCLKAELKDENKTVVVQQGDGMFAFPVPEPAFEDTSLLPILLNKRKIIKGNIEKTVPPLLNHRFIQCLLMIDFCNPLDSRRRSRLLKYIPETAIYKKNKDENKIGEYDLVDKIVKGIEEVAKTSSEHSTEAVFLKYWKLEEEALKTNCKKIIEQYFTNLQINLQEQDGVDDLVRLADSRRRMFRRKPLSEFDLTFPVCNNISSDALTLEMTPLGTVCPVLKNARQDLNNFSIPTNGDYKLDRFNPPAYLDDMNPKLKNEWNELVKKWTKNAIKGYPDDYTFDGPRLQYYDPTSTYTSGIIAERDIVWTAFPNQVGMRSVTDKKRWETADSSRDFQDEYCEWSVLRDPDSGKIKKVTFTCEGPEYWSLIAKKDPETLVKLYQKYISINVKKSDLFDSYGYNPRNIWNNNTNTGNIMHLIQKNNTLEAEIELAGGSSVVRVINGRVLTSEQELIKCGSYGNPDRFSDPHIGAVVNSFTRRCADVTIRDPVAIYLGDLDTSAFNVPHGSDDPYSYWKFTRGYKDKDKDKDLFVRGEYEVPADKGYFVGDIKINGIHINYGAQIADYLTVRIPAVVCRIGQGTVPVLTGCRMQKPKNPSIDESSSSSSSSPILMRPF
ncbi:hypothetical protein C1646_679808 [Rhizophagus diaphanus]|nr:hypothetical protein C1646_679808 [Rhizophagus diaphanus] [Rhizophagus sp. MUCL 43196]